MPRTIRRFLKDKSGATAIEYGLIAGLIFLAILASFTLFAGTSYHWVQGHHECDRGQDELKAVAGATL